MDEFNNMPLDEMIKLVQEGNDEAQNYLLKMYQPFIAKCVSEVCKRYIDPEQDDEFSIGLSAFNDALLSFSAERGSSFFSFAKLVVKRRVIDYIRYIKKAPVAASLDETYDVEQMENPLEVAAAKEAYIQEQDAWHRKEEIKDYKEKLATYKLSLLELTEVSPKHQDARESAVEVAKILFHDKALREYVRAKKRLPIKDLIQKVNVSKKTLERNRKFILAMFIVLNEDYVYLKDYLRGGG
ncbi:RNA polymerase sigma-I factor [Virgibacillus alimentarius]|uniref:RNA polymerase sigma factor SigI n=1 Tax=Virgibacillus alimentarius TaxID=698769 RepID=A0ABS4S797_9BACI|nr:MULTISPECIES: RNA polymerase sigma-I factor [Virgibacillus]MBP2257373.1 RNA polymerase sigma factor [Virgibacillus alimentarius]HLR68604.1 RNA polymerase sigma-I factor [Virgibacillus sp.]